MRRSGVVADNFIGMIDTFGLHEPTWLSASLTDRVVELGFGAEVQFERSDSNNRAGNVPRWVSYLIFNVGAVYGYPYVSEKIVPLARKLGGPELLELIVSAYRIGRMDGVDQLIATLEAL